jgi:formylglycine-generating enzyme required for sulfatase activity
MEIDYWRPVPPGSFAIGSDTGAPEERPVRRISLEGGFRLSATPVTRRLYAAFDRAHEGAWLADLPVVQVTWYEATVFCRWLARRGSNFRGARLPREAEWEYACRYQNADGEWWCGQSERLQEVAWYRDNSDLRPHPVGQREASPLGLYDLHGNVREWCWDVWTKSYQDLPLESTVHSFAPQPEPNPEAVRVLRGGCFSDAAYDLRSTARAASRPYLQSELIGFRVLLPGLPNAEDGEMAAMRQHERRREDS